MKSLALAILALPAAILAQTPLPSPTPTLEERKAAMMEKFRAQQAAIRQAQMDASAKAKAEKQKTDEMETLVKGMQVVGDVTFYNIHGDENRGYTGDCAYRFWRPQKREILVVGKLPEGMLTGRDYQLTFYLTGEIRENGGDRTEIARLDLADALAHITPQRKEMILAEMNQKESNSLLRDAPAR